MNGESGRAAHLLGVWCRLLVDALWQAGVREAVISPGSRSTPIVVALAESSDIRSIDVVDERSAAFFALGMARVHRRPVLLVCTSGTAGAHYLPAVIEASHAHVPLIVLTADRPHELQACAAPQTIDQLRLFGVHARAFFDLGLPDPSMGALRALRRTASQAVLAASWPTPGAVHLNLRAKKPLEPGPAVPEDSECEALLARVFALASRPVTLAEPPTVLPADGALELVAMACAESSRGLIVAGPSLPGRAAIFEEAMQLSSRTGYPLIAEATSQLRFGGEAHEYPGAVRVEAASWLLGVRAFRERMLPDVIIELGAPPTLGVYAALLEAAPHARRFVFNAHGWSDPFSSAEALVLGELDASIPALLASLDGIERADEAWSRRWAEAERVTWSIVEGALEASDALGEAEAVAQAIAAVPDDGWLVLSNSLPVRHADAYARRSASSLRVLSQRGASGIDGIISGAAGAAVASGAPVLAILGDLAAMHDLGGLASCRGLASPLVILVLNNDGGRIFEQLPIAERAASHPLGPALLSRFTTPHGLGFESAASMFGLDYRAPQTRAAFAEALAEAFSRPGTTVVEAVVPKDGARSRQRAIAALLEPALAEV